MSESALYITVYKQILQSIERGEYAENSPLPTERALQDKYHVSRHTIRQAIQQLKDDDKVYTIAGIGSFIKPQMFTQPLSQFYSFTDTLKTSNILIQNDIVSHDIVSSDATLAKNTGFPERTMFHKLVRLRSAKEYPLMLETTYLPQSRFVKLDLDWLSKGSLYDFLRKKYDFQVTDASEQFRPVIPTAEERNLLQVSVNTPAILLERFSYEDGILIEYTKSIIRGDKYKFRIDLKPGVD